MRSERKEGNSGYGSGRGWHGAPGLTCAAGSPFDRLRAGSPGTPGWRRDGGLGAGRRGEVRGKSS